MTLGGVEHWCVEHGLAPVVGVDEVGRGPLAGPVCAAAVVLDLSADWSWFELLDDSKKLSANAREVAAEQIREHAMAWAVAWRPPHVIDEINILQASLRAMEEALAAVCASLPTAPMRVFVDGKQKIITTVPQQTLIKGDSRSFHIAAASILAKVARDELMERAHRYWPEYGFDSNKGYPTQPHRKAVAEHGPCPLHRLTFGGVRDHANRIRGGR